MGGVILFFFFFFFFFSTRLLFSGAPRKQNLFFIAWPFRGGKLTNLWLSVNVIMARKLIFIDQIKEAGRRRGEKRKKKADRCIVMNIIPIIGAPNSKLLLISLWISFTG